MAAAEELEEEAICSICLDLFRAPVMLDCGHNFCRGCIALCWAGAAAPSCPQCREPLPGRALRPNRPLGSIAERLRRGRPGPGQERLPGLRAPPPPHTRGSVQLQLESLRREKGELEVQEREERWMCQDCLEKVKAERQKIVPEFKQLRQYLKQQECLLLARLGELEKQIETRLKENAAKFSKKIIYLDGLIKEKERQLSGRECPQDAGDVSSRCERAKFQQEEWMSHEVKKESGVCSEKASALRETTREPQDALTSATGERVEEPYTYVIMTLDPDTAQSQLILSADHRSVTQGTTQQSRPNNPERFDPCPCVLGCGEFNSGKPCWEVEVCCGSHWAVGVALECVKRKGRIDLSPAGGIWAVGRHKEKFQALTSPAPTPILSSPDLQRVRVCVDHAKGQVMFVNVDSGAVIFTFLRATLAGQRIRPWFWVGRGSRLKLCTRT